MSETADVIVAKRIVTRLIELGLLKPERAERCVHDLSTGRVTSADWKLLADPPLDPGDDDAQ